MVNKSTETIIYPGIANAPTTHHLVVKAVMKKGGTIFCDSFWSNGYVDKVRVLNSDMKFIGNNEVKKGDEVYFDFYYFVAPQPDNPEDTHYDNLGSKKEEAIKKHEGKLLFRYKIDDSKFYYLSVSDIVKGDPVFGE